MPLWLILVPLVATPPIAYRLGRRTAGRAGVAGAGALVAVWVVIALVTPDLGGVFSTTVFAGSLVAAIWGGGRFVRSAEMVALDLAARSLSLERQRAATAQLAVEIERTQLATQLDLAARDRIRNIVALCDRGDDPDAFGSMERLAREALDDMRELLGALRGDARGARAPRPTLAQLETLLAEVRRGGRPVELTVGGERRRLPDAIELAAYRVVQHAVLALGGGRGDTARVALHYGSDALEVRADGLAEEGPGPRAALVAARERVTAHGGRLEARQADGGRLLLHAVLPIALDRGRV